MQERSLVALVWIAIIGISIASVRAEPTTAPATRPTSRPVVVQPRVPTDQPAAKEDGHGNISPPFLAAHQAFLARGKKGKIGLLFLGDSITQGWNSAKTVWQSHYGNDDPANFGIGGDTTQNVLWRIQNGELDQIHPKVVVLLIGTNNIGASAVDILKGDTKLLLLGIFPRGADPKDPRVAAVREKIKTVNLGLAKLDDGEKTRYLDIGDKFLNGDGVITKDIMRDALHPTAKGYQIWADAMQPLLDEMMK